MRTLADSVDNPIYKIDITVRYNINCRPQLSRRLTVVAGADLSIVQNFVVQTSAQNAEFVAYEYTGASGSRTRL